MAPVYSQIFKVSIALAVALLATLLFPTVVFPLLPPLRPLASQLLVRLRDVVAFLVFTTAIAMGIFSAQRKDAQNNKIKKPFMEHHPLGSLFGEPGCGDEIEHLDASDEDAHAFFPKKMEMSSSGNNGDNVNDFSMEGPPTAMANGYLLHRRSARVAMEASHDRKLPFSKEDNGITSEPKVQKKLHRKSSSLDDSVNYEPEVEAERAVTPDSTPPATGASVKPKLVKKVSFSTVLPPSSSTYESQDVNVKQTHEDAAEKHRDVKSASPGDLDRQADAFIAKFKEQIRMQRLESFQRYRRRVA